MLTWIVRLVKIAALAAAVYVFGIVALGVLLGVLLLWLLLTAESDLWGGVLG